MKRIRTLIYLVLLVISIQAFAANHQPYALIYNGITTCEGCPETIAEVVQQTHLPVKYVKDPNAIPALLKHAAIFIIGGTEDDIEPMRTAFREPIVRAIKEYLTAGGHYLGICGGGFIAAKNYDAENNVRVTGFGIIPATAEDYSTHRQAHLQTINWRSKEVVLYFQGGPTFVLDKNAENIDLIAKYQNGDIAAFSHSYGKGTVTVIGPHPEADKTWLEEDHIKSNNWQPQQQLLVDLIKQQLNIKKR